MATMREPFLRWRSAYGSSAERSRSEALARLALYACIVVGVALRVHSIWSQHFWGDELFNFSLSEDPWKITLKRAAFDMAHPPLYYLLLKPWIYLADSYLPALRILNVAISIAAFVPFYKLARAFELRTREVALAFLLMAINGYLIVYGYYLRSYSLLFFLALCSHLYFVKLLRRDPSDNNKTLTIFIVVNILFVNTHYFGWLAFAAQYLWTLFVERTQLRRMTVAAAIITLGFLPWVGVIIYTLTKVTYTFWHQVSWDTRPDLYTIRVLLRSFNGGFESPWLTWVGSILFLLLITLALIYARRSARGGEAVNEAKSNANSLLLLAWLSAFPVVFSLAAAYALSWIWAPRYVIVSIGPHLLLIAACAFRPPSSRMRRAAVIFILVWTIASASTGDLPKALHGWNAPSWYLVQSLSRAESQATGPVHIYCLSPYAEQGLRLALNLTGEQRFKTIPYQANAPLPDNYFWIALTENDPLGVARLKELAQDPRYSLGEPIYAGVPPARHLLIRVQWR